MNRKLILIYLFALFCPVFLFAQVKVRIFASNSPNTAVFSVTDGKFEINTYSGITEFASKGDIIIISKFNDKIAVKTRYTSGILCDSLLISGGTHNDRFSLRVSGEIPVKQYYSGDLKCLPDFGTLVFINICDPESYIAGVVRAEGGYGKNIEYLKTQAIIARTYMYRYFNKHINDGYNLCDNTHCQAFNGITTDTVICRAADETKGMVILGPDTTLIISTFHSNCGGETSPSENVWLSGQTYLRKVADPYCTGSRNATWQQSYSLDTWIAFLRKNGFEGNPDDKRIFNFSQQVRAVNYLAGTFSIPLRQIRSDLGLRSTFFSVTLEGDSVKLSGKGYGHGVGLCQEGAMSMASKGFNYKQIIEFYYTGVIISDIKDAIEIQDE